MHRIGARWAILDLFHHDTTITRSMAGSRRVASRSEPARRQSRRQRTGHDMQRNAIVATFGPVLGLPQILRLERRIGRAIHIFLRFRLLLVRISADLLRDSFLQPPSPRKNSRK
ncbi:hypothetical protein WS46_18680 [Burkholderia sp. RF4-BP95]|nr:hypothetical protein WS46_18680 [Burkholderia sp. RF4-BP95]